MTAAVERGECDLLVDVAAELPLQAIARLLGVPQEDRHRLFGWADTTLDHDDHDLGETTERQQQAAGEMFAYGTDLIERRRVEPGDDLLSIVANADLSDPRRRCSSTCSSRPAARPPATRSPPGCSP
ncbi:MAG: hypothetical protein R2746_00500 [Acidimicrobiales bacterium]